ncbi:MAG: hypothetical protein ABI828_00975 [Actinomycetota bacterium]
MSAREFDPFAILRRLTDGGIRFVIIGGFGAGLHGSPALTGDLDICYDRRADNLSSLGSALASLHAVLRVADQDEGVSFPLDAQALRLGDTFTLWTDLGPLDILATPSGTAGYDDLDADAVAFDVGEGLVVRVASIQDIIRMKRASGREKDAAHISALQVVADAQDR